MKSSSVNDKEQYVTSVFVSCKVNGLILYSSSNCFDLLNYEQLDWMGTKIQDYLHPDDCYLVESYFHVPQNEQCNCRIHMKNGTYIWVKLQISKILNEHMEVKEVILNINEYPSQEKPLTILSPQDKGSPFDLSKDEISLFNLLEEAPFGVMVNSMSNILYMNKECASILRIPSRQEWLGSSALEFVHEDYKDIARNRIISMRNGDQVGIIEQKWRAVDGADLCVEVKSSKALLQDKTVEYIVINDISSRKQFQQILQTSRERYRRLVQNSIDTIAVILDEEWVFINDSGVKLFGAKDYSEIIGGSIYDLLHPNYHEVVKKKLQFVLSEKVEDGITDGQWFTLDGRLIHSEIVAIPVTYQQRKAVQVIIRDISDRKDAEKLMLESEKLSIAGQLAAGIAHEIRNPLTSIKGFVQLMRSGMGEKAQYYEIITSELDRIEIILSELLMLAKPQDSSFKETNIIHLLTDIICLLETQAILHNIRITLTNRLTIQNIVCDENQLKQVFINLVKNSIEAMPKGGMITISVEDLNKSTIKLSFIDQGCGVPVDLVDKIGHPFVTTKENGTGLGLMVSYRIIENHKGTVNIDSIEGEGTTFTLTLPRC
ncbi:PAS domain-containing protein [Bacillus sp. DJP31]|uniref:PAS domain-containing protein n=1 Tax=Bacillus sp. DJP31 TaxID=3409789 RepID=UPI003BB51AE0